jgi:hypothetical protein
MKKTIYSAACLLLLTACATAPSAPQVVTCPRVPPMAWPAPEPSFTEPMELFLSGSLPAPISYELTSQPAKPPTTRP